MEFRAGSGKIRFLSGRIAIFVLILLLGTGCLTFAEGLDSSDENQYAILDTGTIIDDCYALTTIGDVSHWNTASLIDAGGWLNGASSFTGDNGTLDLSGWDMARRRGRDLL